MDSDAFANRLADENLQKDPTIETTKKNVVAYMGDQPIIGGIKVMPKEKFNIKDHLHISFTKKTISIIAIISGLLLLLIATGGYFAFNGLLGSNSAQPDAENTSNQAQVTQNQIIYQRVTYANKQLPNSILEDPFINDVSNINSTSSLKDTLARFINLQIRNINFELKNIQIQSPE